jgi:hypothetical protein
MKMLKGLAIVFVVLALSAGGGYYYWTGTPEHSLLQIKNSVDSHDIELFNKHVDVESMLSRAVDAVMEQTMAKTTNSNASGSYMLGTSMAAGMVAMMKPKIVDYATNKIEMAIEGKSLGGSESASSNSLAKTKDKPLAGVESFFEGDGNLKQAYLRKEQNIAYLGLERFDTKLNETLTLEFKLRKLNGYWQVVEISNLKEMLNRREELTAKRLAVINAPIHERLDSSISVAGVAKKNTKVNRWKQKVLVGVLLTNNTGEELRELIFQCDLLDEKNNVIRALILRVNGVPIAEEKEFSWEFSINKFIKEDKLLLALPEGQMKYAIQVQSLTLSNGEKVAPVIAI